VLRDAALAHCGHIDILVNNAGIIQRCDAVVFSEPDWDG
jgi:2-deoxy-D-gluconate 3-dehydrogenase